jgi:hypothetical protein
MFAPKVAKAQTKAIESPTGKQAPQRSPLAARPFGGGAVEQVPMLKRGIDNQATLRLLAQRASRSAGNEPRGHHEPEAAPENMRVREAPRGVAFDFSKIPIFPPDRATPPQALSPLNLTPLLGVMQPKLAVGQINDPLEHEADRIADQVMSMREPMPIADAPPQVSRKCAAAEKEETKTLQTKRTDAPAPSTAEAPGSAHMELGSPGQRLDAATRFFFEPRFGHDFTRVRVHADARAAASAAEVGARAYAVVEDIVFGAGEYAPWTPEGQRLLAHELAHVVQQGSARGYLRRAPCRSASQCATPTRGDPGQFAGVGTAAETARTAANAAAPAGSLGAALRARRGEHAIHIEKLLNNNGIPLRPEVAGFFVNPGIDPGVVGAQTERCRFFPGGSPGTPPAPVDKMCVQVPAEMEDTAKGLDIVGPLSSGQRDALATDILAVGTHEMQHAAFDIAQEAVATRTIAAAADCSLDTIVTPPDINVEFFLSEISAITSEFPVFFENMAKSPHAAQNLDTEERRQAFDSSEGLVGAIKGMQCACSCATVESFVTQTVNLTTASWAPATKTAFLKAMTGWMPSFWPKALQLK